MNQCVVNQLAGGNFMTTPYVEACEILDEMAETSSSWKSRANVPQGDPNMIHLHKVLQDHGQVIAELTTTMTQLAKAQLHQTQAPKQVHVVEEIDIDDSVEEIREEVNPSMEHMIDMPDPTVKKAKIPFPKPPPYYPQRLSKQNDDNQFKKFIQMMKRLSINVPLVEALEQIPGNAKYMKDLVTKKR
uniref:Uncharacterized protein LOC104241023 n=1 Tax=Nicotiana sylvestris TaxID=4096 RepID=A0A1U7XTF7_NICSY|nr:PREDICTED: uncharacterized protein LOC104241023 [Nicotiana sylvestris]